MKRTATLIIAVALAASAMPPAVAMAAPQEAVAGVNSVVLQPNDPRRWGGLDLLVGRTFRQRKSRFIGGINYTQTYRWEIPGEVLAFDADIEGTVIHGTYQIDPATGLVAGYQLLSDGSLSTPPVMYEGRPIRTTIRVLSDNTYETTTQQQRNGVWRVMQMGRNTFETDQVIQARRDERDAFWSGVAQTVIVGAQMVQAYNQSADETSARVNQEMADARRIDAERAGGSGSNRRDDPSPVAMSNSTPGTASGSSPRPPLAAPAPSNAPSPTSGPRTASKPLIFVLTADAHKVVPTPDGGWYNARCYSAVVTVSGPPGWGTPEWGGLPADGPALDQILRPYIARFQSACAAHGGEGRIVVEPMTNQYDDGAPAGMFGGVVRATNFIIPL